MINGVHAGSLHMKGPDGGYRPVLASPDQDSETFPSLPYTEGPDSRNFQAQKSLSSRISFPVYTPAFCFVSKRPPELEA